VFALSAGYWDRLHRAIIRDSDVIFVPARELYVWYRERMRSREADEGEILTPSSSAKTITL
jgi:hypothetical protein